MNGMLIPASSSSLSCSSARTCFSSQAEESAACSSGLLAFHTSQTGWNAVARSSGSAWPSAAGSDISEISAPLPRCDSTWATLQSRSVGLRAQLLRAQRLDQRGKPLV